MIRRLLVANRGEIARRVIRTCRDLGISPVAVYADPDAGAPHAGDADLAVRLPGSAAADTYLRGDLLLAAADRTGADAVHPGYGFLAESAAFARAVRNAGLTWVGAPPDAIAAMGSKVEAKRLLAAAGVPVLPTWAPAEVPTGAYPVLVKASAGGGGRGMRVVAGPSDLHGAVESASREAAAAFGDGTVFVEPHLRSPRHIEVQVLADQQGNILALGERECSVQRRHQKIVEEAPSPVVGPALRARLTEAAVTAAREVGYVGAGTVEFLLTADGDPVFLEMNTRLQVEHPVTECVTGLDLVALQLAVAEGRPLPFAEPPSSRGHAIEVRLYAEDPTADWRPSIGTLHRLAVPGVTARFAPLATEAGLRLDSGVEDGVAVSSHYDPMLAKVIAWAPTREEAARRLAEALARAAVHGLRTNRDLLVRTLRHPHFLVCRIDTGFLDRTSAMAEELLAPLVDGEEARRCALAAALAAAHRRRAEARVLVSLPIGWRNNPSQPATAAFDGPPGRIEVAYRPLPDGVRLLAASADRVALEACGVRREYGVHAVGTTSYVDSPDGGLIALSEVDPLPEPVPALPEGSLTAPMPGTVLRVAVTEGRRVDEGGPVLTLEAMKMEHQVTAPAAGTVGQLLVAEGSQVDAGAVLAVIKPDPDPAEKG
jgi:propionyl-CoA carboxylase alpha chain